MGGGTEIPNTDETYSRTNHIHSIDGMDRYLVALNGKRESVGDTRTHNTQHHLCSFWPSETLHNLLFRHLDAGNSRVVDGDDAVTGNDADSLRRPVGNWLNDDERVLHHIKLHADALEVPVEGFLQFLHLLGCGV